MLAARRLGDAAEAEDVAQETLRRVLEALRAGKVRDLEALPSFVFQTARNLCLQGLRRRGRQERAFAGLAGAAGPPAAGALERLISGERRARVATALDRLPAADRELLRLVFVDDLEAPEVARRLGLRAGALRVRKHRALKRLEALLEAAGDL